MNEIRPHVRGGCPGALRPMQSGDGLIVRLRPRAGAFALDDLMAVADISVRHGNGLIDLTRRANLQLRGVRGLPTGLEKTVVLTGDDDQPRGELIHPQIQRALGRAAPLDHAENLEPVLAPGTDIGGLDTQISQRLYRHDLSPLTS